NHQSIWAEAATDPLSLRRAVPHTSTSSRAPSGKPPFSRGRSGRFQSTFSYRNAAPMPQASEPTMSSPYVAPNQSGYNYNRPFTHQPYHQHQYSYPGKNPWPNQQGQPASGNAQPKQLTQGRRPLAIAADNASPYAIKESKPFARSSDPGSRSQAALHP